MSLRPGFEPLNPFCTTWVIPSNTKEQGRARTGKIAPTKSIGRQAHARAGSRLCLLSAQSAGTNNKCAGCTTLETSGDQRYRSRPACCTCPTGSTITSQRVYCRGSALHLPVSNTLRLNKAFKSKRILDLAPREAISQIPLWKNQSQICNAPCTFSLFTASFLAAHSIKFWRKTSHSLGVSLPVIAFRCQSFIFLDKPGSKLCSFYAVLWFIILCD